MVKLSPKALRFAESAAEQVANADGFRPDQQRIWQNWSRQTADTVQRAPGRPQGGYIELPNAVASMFLHAIGKTLGSVDLKATADEDPDLGNDLEFLQAIKASLESELGSAVRG
jgi:hypothetical protein